MKVNQSIRGRIVQTIRACPAMHDWTKSGYILTANRDMQVLVGSDREIKRIDANLYNKR